MEIGDKVAARYDNGEETYVGKIVDFDGDVVVVKCGIFGKIMVFERDIDYVVVLRRGL